MSSPGKSSEKAPEVAAEELPQRPGVERDTIAAIATPAGVGGVGIIRLSGTKVTDIAGSLCGDTHLRERFAHYREFLDGNGDVIDDGLAIRFTAPRSFTGEDCLELQCHGGRYVLARLLQRCLELGAREARAGEFTERAFLNDKIDLVQAEAIADLIAANSDAAARQAQASLRGVFSDAVNSLADDVTALRVYVEAALDFPDEDVDFLSDGKVAASLESLTAGLQQLLDKAREGALFQAGAQLVLAGKPNAGKSSLLNVLSGDDVAIVTSIPGTTRDLLKENIVIGGVPFQVVDTAGLRTSDDPIEREGIRRAETAIRDADITLLVIDDEAEDSPTPDIESKDSTLLVFNKIDRSGRSPGVFQHINKDAVALSVHTGAGIDALKSAILDKLGLQQTTDNRFSARQRHIHALESAGEQLEGCRQRFSDNGAGELLAEDLKLIHATLGQITGVLSSDELLGEIFSSFCIGK